MLKKYTVERDRTDSERRRYQPTFGSSLIVTVIGGRVAWFQNYINTSSYNNIKAERQDGF